LALAALAQINAAEITMPVRGLCAHRGAMSTHPENTIPALVEAVRLGAHMIEFDIQFTKDGALVLMHDSTVNRTTNNGLGKVSDLTLAQIKSLDAGSKFGAQFAGTRIPTF
jgi:glycerophosphoryl diester phosphodiesterase